MHPSRSRQPLRCPHHPRGRGDEREARRLEPDAEAAYRLGVRVAGIGALLRPVSGLAIQGAFLAVLGVDGYRVAPAMLSVADLVTFILYLFKMVIS